MTYGYGPSGRRLYKTVDGETTWFIWSGTQLIAEYSGDTDATLAKRYDYLPGSYAPSQVFDGSNTYSVYSDHLQTPKWMLNSEGEVAWRSNREAFGQMFVDEDVDGDGTEVTLNIRFPGQYYDAESGLHYNYYRDYDPGLGRYVERDPIGLDGGINTYVYVSNNSLTLVDPEGKAYSWPALVAGAALGGLGGFFYELGTQLYNWAYVGEEFSWTDVGASTAGGAVVGGILGALLAAMGGDPSALLTAGAGVEHLIFLMGGSFLGGSVEAYIGDVCD